MARLTAARKGEIAKFDDVPQSDGCLGSFRKGSLHAVHARNVNVDSPAGDPWAPAVAHETAESEARTALDPLLEHFKIPAEHLHIIDGPPTEIIESVIRDVAAQSW